MQLRRFEVLFILNETLLSQVVQALFAFLQTLFILCLIGAIMD